jgi:hypothetical protein
MKKKPTLTTIIGGIIDKMSYEKIGFLIVFLLLFCATLFWLLTPYGNGTNQTKLDWFNALYFSIITFSSLGYGDILPVGCGKLISSIEVLLGLLLTAIFIGKIASERQYVMLRLIYTSTHQRRLVELEQEFERLNDELDIALDEHNHDKLYFLSNSIYRFVASTGKYLHFQSSEGDLASFGNNSAFRRLYQSILTLQLTIYEAIRTSGIKEKSKKNYEQISTRINGIIVEMKKYHNNNDDKIDALLDEISQLKVNIDNWNSELEKGKATYKFRNAITDYIIEKVAERIPKDKWIKNTHKKIAEELGISNNLAEMCVDKIFKEGIIVYNEKTDN